MTLPNIVQSRIFSYLVYERQRFCRNDLIKLAKSVLSEGQELDFWVKKTALQLLDALSASDYEWVSYLNLDSEEVKVEDKLRDLPDWLKDVAKTGGSVLPWLPISPDELDLRMPFSSLREEEDLGNVADNESDKHIDKITEEIQEVITDLDVSLDPEIGKMVESWRLGILNFETLPKTVEIANEIHRICSVSRVDSLALLNLIEPWKADDETASVLIFHLLDGNEDELGLPSQLLCSIMLPKMLDLKVPASRVLLTAIIEYCKVHQKAAEYALLFPLMLKVEGINNPICDVITRIFRECLHPVHVSAFFQKLLCNEVGEEKFICLPCHRCLIASELEWTESFFTLMQNVLNHNVHFTQDTVDELVHGVCKVINTFSCSLKFGNFVLCLVNKCSPLLKSHKLLLIQTVERTNTLVTKSILSKLNSL